MNFIDKTPQISVIIPVYNGAKWIDECFCAILNQDILKKEDTVIEISVYDDCSTDEIKILLEKWKKEIENRQNVVISLTFGEGACKGVGYARNKAVQQSTGKYLCFQDIDDIMMCERVSEQLIGAKNYPNAIIGSKFVREPADSTVRFTKWANSLSQDLLTVQVYTSHGPTVIMPTWFCTRQVFDRVGGFIEDGPGTPEDLIFFYKHLSLGGDIVRVDQVLLTYRYHSGCTTFSVSEDTIWKIRLERLESMVLPQWSRFTIWNAGKIGRKLYRSLSKCNQLKVQSICDVDKKKIGTCYEPYEDGRTVGIPIVHFTQAAPPFIICVKLDLTDGQFENNLKSLNLEEGKDYVLFT